MSVRADSIGTAGVIVGFIALGIVLFQFFYGPIHKNEASFITTAKSQIHAILAEKHASTHSSTLSDVNFDNALTYTSVLFAFLAILAGTVSYIRNAKKETAYASLSVGAATLFFHFILVAIGVVIILAIIAYILNY